MKLNIHSWAVSLCGKIIKKIYNVKQHHEILHKMQYDKYSKLRIDRESDVIVKHHFVGSDSQNKVIYKTSKLASFIDCFVASGSHRSKVNHAAVYYIYSFMSSSLFSSFISL